MSKKAICCKCGKDLEGTVPDDAEEVTCFKCNEAEKSFAERDGQGYSHDYHWGGCDGDDYE
jgi:hypothetical protein